MIITFLKGSIYNTTIGEANTFKEAFAMMQEFVKSKAKLNWNSRCIGINFDPKEDFFIVDFGSYTYFCKCQNISEANWEEFFQGNKPKKQKPHEIIGIPIQKTEYWKKRGD